MNIEAINPTQNDDGSIDIDLNHPDFGWISFTARHDDPEEHGRGLYEMASSGEFGAVAIKDGGEHV